MKRPHVLNLFFEVLQLTSLLSLTHELLVVVLPFCFHVFPLKIKFLCQ